MKVLIGCECSGVVRRAFRALGHDAYSCDIEKSDDDSKYHIQDDVLNVMNKNRYDLGIFHPPCTYITNTSVRWLYSEPGRYDLLELACEFFVKLYGCNIKRVALENPIPHGQAYTRFIKYADKFNVKRDSWFYDQLIQPYHYGHLEQKATCLWLKNLPILKHVTDLRKETKALPVQERCRIWYMSGDKKQRSKDRSQTYEGIGKAFADQWGSV